MSLAAFWHAVPKADRKSREWLKGNRITLEDLKTGRGAVERVTPEVWFSKSSMKSAAGAAKGPLRVNFGKYKGKLATEVRSQDPHYWNWAIDNVDWFAKQAEEAGL